MVARKALPDEHHVMRFASQNKQFRDPDTAELMGLALSAFILRPDDRGGLSVTWMEYFGAADARSRKLAAEAHERTLDSKKLPKNGVFAWAKASTIKAAAKRHKKTVRIVHDPVPGNDGHAEVRHFTDDDFDLLEHFATDVFLEFDTVPNIMAAC